MCKYINFNNLGKKKRFADGGVVVGWNSPLWKHKKQLRKHIKKEEKTRKTIYYLNSEKTMKTSFYCSKKVIFENTENIKNKNIPPSPNKFFEFVVFKNIK